MKRFIKDALPLIIIATAILLASCSNSVAKKTYKCDEESEVLIEFKKDLSVVIYWDMSAVKKAGEDDAKCKPMKFQIATGSYRVNNDLLTVTIGSARSITNLKNVYKLKGDEDKWPKTFADIGTQDEYTFQIQNKGASLISNYDCRTWSKH